MTYTAERKIGSRIIRKGDVVKIKGERGDFRVHGFEQWKDGSVSVEVYGGKPGRVPAIRSFDVERIGRRPRRTKGS